MVRAVEEEKEILKSQLGQFKGMFEGGERQTRSLILENNGSLSTVNDDRVTSRSHASIPLHDHEQLEQPKIGSALDRTENVRSRLANDSRTTNPHARERQHSGEEKCLKYVH